MRTKEISIHFCLETTSYNSIRITTDNKLDENERNINTLLFGNDQLHLETNKKIFAIVHDVFAPNRPLVNLYKSAKICLGYKRRSTRFNPCLLYTSPSPRDRLVSRMPSSA